MRSLLPTRNVKLARLLLLTLIAFMTPQHAAHAISEPGTMIHNRAEIAYFDTASGLVVRTLSNTSTVVVAAVQRFVVEGTPETIAHAGKFVSLPYRIHNTGNVADAYRLVVTDLGGDAGALGSPRIYHDLNGNGIADPGEPLVPETSSVLPGEMLELVLAAQVPTEARDAERYLLELSVESLSGEIPAEVRQSAIMIVDGAFVSMHKASTVSCDIPLQPGADIDYRIDFTNSGNRAPDARLHDIDGTPMAGVLIVDNLPSGTTLRHDGTIRFAPHQGIPVVQGRADGDAWTRFESWDGTTPARRLALYVPAENLATGQTGSFEFTLQTRDFTLPETVIENTAGIDIDGDGRDEFESNTVCNRLIASGVELGVATDATLQFVEPAPELRRTGTTPQFGVDEDWVETGSYRLDNGVREYDPVRDGLYLELSATNLDTSAFIGFDSTGGTLIVVTLSSLGTGDSLKVLMVETAPDSGMFRSIRPIRLTTDQPGNGGFCPGGETQPDAPVVDYEADAPACQLQSLANDTLQVLLADAGIGISLTDTVVIDPIATVFDAYNLAPVAGATITIRRIGSLPSGAFSDDPGTVARDVVTDEPLVMVSGPDGRYSIPPLRGGFDYHITVEPPAAWLFPSLVSPAQFLTHDVNRFSYGIEGFGSLGVGVFRVPAGAANPLADIPLDPADRDTRLAIDKQVLQSEVEPGEVVAYAIELRNQSEGDQYNVHVIDRMPFGFKLVPGSSSLDGESIEEPAGAPGSVLDFALGTLEMGTQRQLTYVLEATAGAVDSDGINTAAATARTISGVEMSSRESRARVRIRRNGVLSDRAALFGKIYIDADCNNLHNDAEWPIGGVKLYLEDGTFAITDENGQYSLYGLAPGQHALRVDPITMPSGLTFKPIDNANAAVGDSRFVELSSGDFHRADFAAACPLEKIEAVFAEISKRNAAIDGAWLLDEAEDFDPNDTFESRDALGRERLGLRDADIDGDLSNGVLNGPDVGRTRSEKQLEDEAHAEAENQALLPTASVADDPILDPKIAAQTITNQQAKTGTWLWPTNDTSLDGRFVAVVRSGVTPMLFVNGQPVAETQIGERIENRRENAQIVAWYGVMLRSGLNRIEVRGKDGFGNTRVLAKGDFKRPAMGSRMVLRARRDTLPADGGRSVLPIEINILDDNDYAAQGVHFVTLEASGSDEGGWLEEDLQDSEPGHQVRVEDGRATVHLRSSEFTGTVRVRAFANDMSAEMRIYQIAALRPLFGIGLLEFGIISADVMGNGFAPSDQADDLEDGTRVDGSLSMFLKGRVKGNAQLTLSYDTDKQSDSELLRDINPNAHYPIHGDASVRGYEAQSRSKLYAKLERGKNSVMWGDYVTDADTEVDDLARVQRVLTGFNSRYETGRTRFQLFAARPEDARRSEEIRGNGTAMLFRLTGAPIVSNSEIIELIVRNRENPGLVVSVQRLSRFSDYVLDSISGQLKFANPVPSFDEALNPVFVRISYDQENGGDAHTIAGARVRHALSDALVAGVTYTEDDNPLTGGKLGGAYVEYRPDERTGVTLGMARMTHSDGSAAGIAQRLTAEHSWGGERERRTALTIAQADEGFSSGEAGISAGRRELRLDHQERLGKNLSAKVEATHSESLVDVEHRSAIGVSVDKKLEKWTLRGGARHVRQRTTTEADNFNTAIIGAERRLRFGDRNGSLDAEYEQDLDLSERNRLGLGAKLQVHEHAQLYGRYEKQTGMYDFFSFGGLNSTETFALGVESDVLANTRLYSEYRMRGGIGGRDMETASGVRGNYELKPGLTISPSLEVVDTLAGDNSADGLALSLGATDTRNPNMRLTGQAEVRKAQTSDYIGLRGSYAARLNLDWTALLRENFTRQDPDVGEITMRHAFTAGLARRPRLDNRHHMLFQYTWKVERAEGAAADRDVHVLSTHQNFQIGSRLTLTGRLGGKRQTTFLDRDDYDTAAYLADVRASWDIDRRWNLDLRTGVLATGTGRSRRHTAGVGVSHVMDRNLHLQVGYNVVGFRDEDLDPEGYDAHGLRVGFRYKFDDKAFKWLQD